MKIAHKFLLLISLFSSALYSQKIDRKAVVSRHNVHLAAADSFASLTVGNGAFAFTVDVTGLQSFPEYYDGGVSLGTQSEWGWHSLPNTENFREEEALKTYDFEGKQVSYAVQGSSLTPRQRQAADYFRENLHRLQLGNVGLLLVKKDGTKARIEDIKKVDQTLDLWKGEITSRFVVESVPVEVITCASPLDDAIAVKIKSFLVRDGRLRLSVRFPYPTMLFLDDATNYKNVGKHKSVIESTDNRSARIRHTLDTTTYFVNIGWKGLAKMTNDSAHFFQLQPGGSDLLETVISFSPRAAAVAADFNAVQQRSVAAWQQFWTSGAAIDLAGSTDPRAKELERRIVLSQYLSRVQCAGNNPPQETGLTFNSWFGKPHMEMYWWHAAHYALWNRADLMEKSIGWYARAEQGAKELAARQGYKGVRWQKMTDNEGRESPSSVGAFLIWQQPHLIYLAELLYRNEKNPEVLKKYAPLVFATADFMASYPHYDSVGKKYNLGRGLIPAQECFKPEETFNPTYELAYWSWALSVAQEWKKRLGMPVNREWEQVVKNLAPLPIKDGVYLATESTPDSYAADSKYTIDHPAVLAALAGIPAVHNLQKPIMLNTYNLIEKIWHWDHTWGWDYPMVAMTATRLDQPEKAIDALLMKVQKNTYLPNGHNYQDARLRIYLPGNGGLLAAVALMCAGYDGNKTPNPGFPKNGKWRVRWEGFKPMP